MSLKDMFPVPIIHLNNYVWDTMKSLDGTLDGVYGGLTPFFPLADSRAGDATWEDKPYVVYDHLFKMGDKRVPAIHKFQGLYFVRGKAEDVIVWTNAIHHILDRGDYAAQDCNAFLASTSPTAGVYFHNIRSMQIDMVKDSRQDLAIRQYYVASMIIDMQYHITKGEFN